MGSRILWINPITYDIYDEAIGRSLRAETRSDTRLDIASLHGTGPRHLEFNAYELISAKPTLETILWAEEEGYDAAVIGCFYDPYIRAAKELTTRMAVTGPAEASIRIAQSAGERFSILVGRDKWIPEMEENVRRYGAERSLASFRTLGMGVDDFQADTAFTEKRIREEAQAAITTDRADVIILGCTIEFGFYRKLQKELAVPIIDATVAPLLWAELLADAVSRHQWTHSSRLGYNTPDQAELGTVLRAVKPNLSVDPR